MKSVGSLRGGLGESFKVLFLMRGNVDVCNCCRGLSKGVGWCAGLVG